MLFVLVTVGAVGLSGLLGRLFDALPGNLPGNLPGGVDALAGDATSGLAQALAVTLIGGPLGAVLWWAV